MKKISVKVLSLLCVFVGFFAAPPQGMAQFASQATWGGTSTGTANAQVVSIANVGSMSDLVGVTISFIPGAGLTNSGATTFQIGALAAQPVRKVGYGVLAALTGGELVAGAPASALWDGTEWVLQTNYAGPDAVGTLKTTASATADAGYLLAYGQCVSQTTYAALYAALGTTYGTGCSAGQFPVPDMRGRAAFGKDNMGGTAANRITSAGGLYNGTVLGAAGGVQSTIVSQTNLASFNLTTYDPGHSHGINRDAQGINDPGHTHTYQIPNTGGVTPTGNGGSINSWTVGAFNTTNTGSATTSITVCQIGEGCNAGGIAIATAYTGIIVQSGGSNVPLPTLSPSIIVNYEIKY